MTEESCQIGVLGPLTFVRDGQSVALPSGHQRSLLALLLMAGGAPLSRDRLIDELWGESPPASAVSALHVHLSKLRELLDDLIVREPAGYSLQADAVELDCDRFDELVERARADPGDARALLREALGLIRGEPLCDVACEGRVAEWRRTLEEKRLQALSLRIDADLAAGSDGELVAELESLASEHPFEERLWGQLMLALYRSGRQADALEAFARARRTLAAELGLEPGEQLAQLHARMLERDSSLLLARSTAADDAQVAAAPSDRARGAGLEPPGRGDEADRARIRAGGPAGAADRPRRTGGDADRAGRRREDPAVARAGPPARDAGTGTAPSSCGWSG